MGRKGIRLIRPNRPTNRVDRSRIRPIIPRTKSKPRKILPSLPPAKVSEQKDSVFVVGGGPSLSDFNFDLLTGFDVISINSAVFHVPLSRYFITCDYTYLSKISDRIPEFVAHGGPTKIFVVNMWSGSDVVESGGVIKDVRFNILYDLRAFDMVIKSRNQSGVGYAFNDFRSGGNSGFCGFQLATIMGYKTIYLLGIDLVTNSNMTHFHDDYKNCDNLAFSRKLQIYRSNFKDGINDLISRRPNVNVISCSPISSLNNLIKYKNIEEIVEYERNKSKN